MQVKKLHSLKTWPEMFEAIRTGRKTFELRKNDRDFREGDILLLQEFDPETGIYSGREIRKQVTFLLSGGFGLPKGLCVMALGPVQGAR